MKNFIIFQEQIISKDQIKRIWIEDKEIILLDKDNNKYIMECNTKEGAGNIWLALEKELTTRIMY